MNVTEEMDMVELVKALDECGATYYVPDTEVQYYPDGVKCGIPDEMAAYRGDMLMLPKEMLGMRPTVVVIANGDSMKDAGIYDGDKLTVEATSCVHDGEIVIASIDNECTAKTFFTDANGVRWLLPRNRAYLPIELDEDKNVIICGRVVAVTHEVRHASYSECLQLLNSRDSTKEAKALTDEMICNAVRGIEPSLQNGRQWYAVFRVLVDRHRYDVTELARFADDVTKWCPEARYKVNAMDLAKMAVQSFRKKVALWSESNAPVTGKRFKDYLLLAKNFDELLMKQLS